MTREPASVTVEIMSNEQQRRALRDELRSATDTVTDEQGYVSHITRFDSQGDLARFSQRLSKCCPLWTDDGGWNDEYSAERDARQLLGDEFNADIASIIRNTMATVSAAATMSDGYDYSPFGAYPVIPAAIAGDPLSMKRRVAQPSASAPLRFWFPVTTTWSITDETYASAMAFAASMAITLSEARPVEVFTYTQLPADIKAFRKLPATRWSGRDGKAGHFIVTPIRTDSMDADAISAWCSCRLGRSTHMQITKGLLVGYNGHWAWNESPSNDATAKRVRDHLGVTDSDVFIPSTFGHDFLPLFKQQIIEHAEQSGVTIDEEALSDALAI